MKSQSVRFLERCINIFFASNRKKAAKAVISTLGPYVRLAERISRLSDFDFLRDPYLLGFIDGSIIYFAEKATNYRISGEDSGLVRMDFFQAMEKNTKEIMMLIGEFTVKKDEEFMRGFDNAIVIHGYLDEKLKDERNIALIFDAEEKFSDTPKDGIAKRELIFSEMLNATFYEEIVARAKGFDEVE